MAGSVNKVILVGNLGKDPEIRTFQNGGRVAHFSIATSENWKDKATGEKKERTEWHRISVFSEGLVGIVERFLKKGAKVYVEGQLETRKFTDKEGKERYTTEVVLRNFGSTLTMLDGKGGTGIGSNANANVSGYGEDDVPAVSGGGGKPAPELDDEIPF